MKHHSIHNTKAYKNTRTTYKIPESLKHHCLYNTKACKSSGPTKHQGLKNARTHEALLPIYNIKACITSEPTIIQNTWVPKNTASEKQGLQNTGWGLEKNRVGSILLVSLYTPLPLEHRISEKRL